MPSGSLPDSCENNTMIIFAGDSHGSGARQALSEPIGIDGFQGP
jgi:hypothetical protein